MQLLIGQIHCTLYLLANCFELFLLRAGVASKASFLFYFRVLTVALCHILVHGGLIKVPFYKITFWLIKDMLIGPGDQEVVITLDILVRYLHIRGWEINATNIQRSSMKFLKIQWLGTWEYVFKA